MALAGASQRQGGVGRGFAAAGRRWQRVPQSSGVVAPGRWAGGGGGEPRRWAVRAAGCRGGGPFGRWRVVGVTGRRGEGRRGKGAAAGGGWWGKGRRVVGATRRGAVGGRVGGRVAGGGGGGGG
nr:rRNA 2'-O-methyltransferase fibrillarin-like [Aegilops tauschii subsp. strangulata]